ncbi:MAG TPA: branched-chain amino acid ABC transporter substrate-binding protein [Anaerolineae bacterium]|nr:branched-chain amino acid ABC transporter substrate-binding protein [Anaerolineae bacterium]HNT04746.1 branched-chain amino acid ABC transporter substrate-binding protein [Anaerolineae bacterium]
MFKRNRYAICVAVVLSLVLVTQTGCGRSRLKGEVFVYVAAPLSGWQADGGQTVVGGVRLMADRINRAGGLLGYHVNVVALDDEADSDVAVSVAEQIKAALQEGKKVIGVVGHYNSGQTLAAMEVYKDLPLIIVTPTASDVSITRKGYSNFFRVNATDAAQAPVDARFLVEKLGARRIVVVHANNEYGRGLRDQMRSALKTLSLEPLAVIEIPEAATSQSKAVAQIKELQPDAIFLAGYETEGYVLLPELREAGITVPFMASDGCFLYEFIDGSGPAAEGAYVSGITPDPKVVADKRWWADYQQIETRNPGTYSVAGYSAMDVIAAGVRQANSFDAKLVEKALRSLKLQTLVGSVQFDSSGDLEEQKVYVFQVKDGEFVQLPAE